MPTSVASASSTGTSATAAATRIESAPTKINTRGSLRLSVQRPVGKSGTRSPPAAHALVSAEGEYFSLQGVEQVLEVMELARDNLNENLNWLGVVMNMADLRTIHSREALQSLRDRFGDRVFESVIRASIRYAESAERGISILDYRPELGADYVALAGEVLERLGFDEERRRAAALEAELAPAARTTT